MWISLQEQRHRCRLHAALTRSTLHVSFPFMLRLLLDVLFFNFFHFLNKIWFTLGHKLLRDKVNPRSTEPSPLVSYEATAPVFKPALHPAENALSFMWSRFIKWWRRGVGAGVVIMTHSRVAAFPPNPPALCVTVSCHGDSAVGGLDGRQRQDATIVGVEVLCVAPRSENRQQWLRVRRLRGCLWCFWGERGGWGSELDSP